MTQTMSARAQAASFAPLAYCGHDPVVVFERSFKARLPEQMRPVFEQAFQSKRFAGADAASPKDVWRVFRETFISHAAPELTYLSHDVHRYSDGSRYVSVNYKLDGQVCNVAGEGISCAEAVLEAFGLAGQAVMRRHAEIVVPNKGAMACAFVCFSQENGKACWGAAYAGQHQTAEVIAATRACFCAEAVRRTGLRPSVGG